MFTIKMSAIGGGFNQWMQHTFRYRKKKLSQDETKEKENLLKVSERCFAVVKEGDSKEILRTGWLGYCVLLYGKNPKTKVAFLAHADCHGRGASKLFQEIKDASDGTLEGFKVIVAVNFAWWMRVLVFLFFGGVPLGYELWFKDHVSLYCWLFLAVTFYMTLGIPFTLYFRALLHFPSVSLRGTQDKCKRAELEIDSTTSDELTGPVRDRLEPKRGKSAYAPPEDVKFFHALKSLTAAASLERKRRDKAS